MLEQHSYLTVFYIIITFLMMSLVYPMACIFIQHLVVFFVLTFTSLYCRLTGWPYLHVYDQTINHLYLPFPTRIFSPLTSISLFCLINLYNMYWSHFTVYSIMFCLPENKAPKWQKCVSSVHLLAQDLQNNWKY